jgi:hypothetical protein
MRNLIQFSILALAIGPAAHADRHSTITFGKLEGEAPVTQGKKLSYRRTIAAVTKAHDTWKKAHLNETLYACQRNGERVALLARKVADRLEAAKKSAVASAKAVEGTVDAALGADTIEVPSDLTSDQIATLQKKAADLGKARKQADLLERLSGQVMKFYEKDMPRDSAVDGDCVAQYKAAVKKGVAASEAYHADTQALAQKLDKLADQAQFALREAAALVASK